jgi:hypothetical protein
MESKTQTANLDWSTGVVAPMARSHGQEVSTEQVLSSRLHGSLEAASCGQATVAEKNRSLVTHDGPVSRGGQVEALEGHLQAREGLR